VTKKDIKDWGVQIATGEGVRGGGKPRRVNLGQFSDVLQVTRGRGKEGGKVGASPYNVCKRAAWGIFGKKKRGGGVTVVENIGQARDN